MKEKTERNKLISVSILLGISLTKTAKIFNVSIPCIENVITTNYRKLLPDEERLRYLPGKVIAKEYNERLLQLIFRNKTDNFPKG